jgi:hypothetical protein
MFAIYAVVGGCGYALYGGGASVLITTDMARDGVGMAAGSSGEWLRPLLVNLVLGSITFKLFCSLPLCIVVLVDIARTTVHEWRGEELSESFCDRLRLVCWAAAVWNAIAVYSSLQYVTALIGINSMLISVLLPIVFYYMLHRHAMSPARRTLHLGLVLLSLAFTGAMAWVDFGEFLESLERLGNSTAEE